MEVARNGEEFRREEGYVKRSRCCHSADILTAADYI